MSVQTYLMINASLNVVENTCVWDGDTNTWQPPANTLMLVQATTPAFLWELNADKTDYVLTEQIGCADIGFTWDGTACITNQPKPNLPPPQPVTEGLQTI